MAPADVEKQELIPGKEGSPTSLRRGAALVFGLVLVAGLVAASSASRSSHDQVTQLTGQVGALSSAVQRLKAQASPGRQGARAESRWGKPFWEIKTTATNPMGPSFCVGSCDRLGYLYENPTGLPKRGKPTGSGKCDDITWSPIFGWPVCRKLQCCADASTGCEDQHFCNYFCKWNEHFHRIKTAEDYKEQGLDRIDTTFCPEPPTTPTPAPYVDPFTRAEQADAWADEDVAPTPTPTPAPATEATADEWADAYNW